MTLVLKRDDEAGFQRYLADTYRKPSLSDRHYLTAREQADRFGPSAARYEAVRRFLSDSALELTDLSENRLTISASGTWNEVERAFDGGLIEFQLGENAWFANTRDPAVPADIASHIAAIVGLSNLPRPGHHAEAISQLICDIQKELTIGTIDAQGHYVPPTEQDKARAKEACLSSRRTSFPHWHPPPPPPSDSGPLMADAALAAVGESVLGLDGSGQTIGIVAFDRFDPDDIVDFLELSGGDPADISNLSQVAVNGGAVPGPDEDEVLLDITAVMAIVPGAQVVVYHAPFAGAGVSYQAIFSAMVDDGVDVISNSWAYCENQTTLADVTSIDAILQSAAAAGISVFNASGDSGSTCLNGSANTVAVPASSPSATAVGGTSLETEAGFLYDAESWWNGVADTPPTGQGGFGVSQFFARPAYQNGHTVSAMRSIPDVAVNSDPAKGPMICQASAGGCPSGLMYGGTSIAAPIWAAFTALLNQANGANLGALNPILYPLANTTAFHDPASMDSDFEHVGLGSPNLSEMRRLLNADPVGLPDPLKSEVLVAVPTGEVQEGRFSVPADGASLGRVIVILRDANGYSVAGKTVSITADPPGDVIISPPSAITNVANGAAFFDVTSLVAHTVEFTATNDTDNLELPQYPQIEFAVPKAATAGILASPTSVPADGTSTSTITVTLLDGLGRPAPGKQIRLSQSDGDHSRILTPVPSATDVNGEAEFIITNLYTETVSYTAINLTDGNLPVPGSADVDFFGGGASCAGPPPVAADGYRLEPFATGFVAQNFFFGGINFGGCQGVIGMAFDASGNLFAADLVTGDVFKFGPGGGVADAGTRISQALGPAVTGLTFGADGKLYVSRAGNVNQDVVEIDPITGALLRDNVGTTTLCPFGLATDPLTGDLFVSDYCFSGGSTAITRIANPGGLTPTTSLYRNTPTDSNGQIAFAADGTLFLRSGTGIVRIAGTDQPSPPAVTTLTLDNPIPFGNLGMAIGATALDGSALSLIGNVAPDPDFGDHPDGITGVFDLSSNPMPTSAHLTNGQAEGDLIGPDGCLYMAQQDTIYRLANADGSCNPLGGRANAPVLVLTPNTASPDPVQGETETFTASLHYIDVAEGMAVRFVVSGANPGIAQTRTDASGVASFSYAGRREGRDEIQAFATVDNETVVSNPAYREWAPGVHATFLSLNGSPEAGTQGVQVLVTASLTDVSADPIEAIEGNIVEFELDGDQCSDATDANGIASCLLTPTSPGVATLTATFSGTAGLAASAASQGFNAVFTSTSEDIFADSFEDL